VEKEREAALRRAPEYGPSRIKSRLLIPSGDIERQTDAHERTGVGSDLDGQLKGVVRSAEAIPGRIRQG
jgi:hypothetical protein